MCEESIKANNYSDLYIIPQYSEICSRTEVDTSAELNFCLSSSELDLNLEIPVMSSNMDTVTNGHMASVMWKGGGIGAIHRFMSIEENVKQFLEVKNNETKCFVSVGVNDDSKDRAVSLFNAGARHFVIDIAHGHSVMMKNMIEWFRKEYEENVVLMCGNVATGRGYLDLANWGADLVKIGVGPGSVCSTKNVTGVTIPQAKAICECVMASYSLKGYIPYIVADGGIAEIGDVAKALGLGADLVMCGKLFAGCKETPGIREDNQKAYRGMASRDAMMTIKAPHLLPTPEGRAIMVDATNESAADVLKYIKGGLQSTFSYTNAKDINQFQSRVKFGVR